MPLDPRHYTIKTAAERLEKIANDPVNLVLSAVPDLAAILEKAAANDHDVGRKTLGRHN
jgi:hypothetical protein